MANIKTEGLLPNSPVLRQTRADSQIEALRRNRAGASATLVGSTVSDATAGPTGTKGKLRLYGDFEGTADLPKLRKGTSTDAGALGVYDIRQFGGVEGADILAALNAAQTAMPSYGGVIFVPLNRVYLSNTFTFTKPITLRGLGRGTFNRAETLGSGTAFYNPATVITWSNASAGTMFLMNGNTRPLGEARLEGMSLNGNNVATVACDFYRVHDGGFRDGIIRNLGPTGIGLRLRTLLESAATAVELGATYGGTGAGQAHVHNTQECHFSHLHIDCPTPIEMIGGKGKVETTSRLWNVCLCYFEDIQLAFGWSDIGGQENTNGCEIWDGDNNMFVKIRSSKLGSGTGVGTLNHGPSRSNKWVHLEPGGGFRVMPPDSLSLGHYNDVQGYDRSNGEPAPTIDAGAHLTWIESGWGASGVYFNVGATTALNPSTFELTAGGDAAGQPYMNAAVVARTYVDDTFASLDAVGRIGATEVRGRVWARENGTVVIGAQSDHPTLFMKNAAEIFRINTNSHLQLVTGRRLGIGLDPSYDLHVKAAAASQTFAAFRDGVTTTSASGGAQIYANAGGTPSAADHRLGVVSFGSDNGTNDYPSRAGMTGFSAEAWTGSARGAYLKFETTPIGSTTRAETVRVESTGMTVTGDLDVTGTITGTIGSSYPILSGTTTDTLAVRSAGTNTFQTIASNTTAGVARLSFLDQGTEKWRVQQGGGSGIETDFQFNIIDATDANHLVRFMSGIPQSTGSTKHRWEYNVTATLPASGRRILNTNVLSTVTGTVSQPSAYDLIDVLQASAHLNTSGGANGISMVALIGEAKVSAAQSADNEVAYLRGASFDQTTTGNIHPTMWGQDLFVHGTRAASGTTGEQNRKIFNIVCGINTYHSSSPSHAPAVGMSITTKYGDVLGAPAGNTDRTHTVDTGLSIHGWAGDANGISHANSKIGFKYAIKIGGTGAWYSGDPWTDTTQHSRIGTGIAVMHYETAGIKVTNRSTIGATSPPAISIGWDNAGAASTDPMDGLSLGGDATVYRSAAGEVAIATLTGGTAAGADLTLKPSSHGSPTGDVVVDLSGGGQNFRLKPPTTLTTTNILTRVDDAFTMGASGQFAGFSVLSSVAVSGTAAATAWVSFYFGPTITLGTAATDDLRQGYVFSDVANINLSATTTAYGTTSNGWRSYRASPIFADRTGGTSTGTVTLISGLVAEPTVGTGWTVTDLRGLYVKAPLGTAGTITTHTGVDIEDLDAYAGTNTNPSLSLRSAGAAVQMRHLGPGVFGANAAPSNASVGLEVQSTTKAFLASSMTTTQRDAMTPLNGMIIYNSTTLTLQGYQNGAWTNL